MTQAKIAKIGYNMRNFLPWITYLLFFTSVICFLVFTGKSAHKMNNAIANNNNSTQDNIYNSDNSFYRELSYQATVISLLTIITFCIVYKTFKELI